MLAAANAALAAFSPITPEIAEHYRVFSKLEGDRSADFSAAGLYLWDVAFPQQVAFTAHRATVRRILEDGSRQYLYPVGEGALAPAIGQILAEDPADVICLSGVTEQGLARLEAEYPGRYTAKEIPELEDYLYTATALVTLSGKKLHAKRNHINAFSALHDWRAERLTPAHFAACREILASWEEGRPDAAVRAEHRAIERALDANVFARFSLTGALLTVDGAPAAFNIGEKLTADTFCVHFEKTAANMTGAYPVINRELSAMVCASDLDIAYINREEDMGLENLRAAKRAYHPISMVRKFQVWLRPMGA